MDESNETLEIPTTPFLIRAFAKVNAFHRLDLFQDGHLPTTDEIQLFAWKSTTLPQLLTILRLSLQSQSQSHLHQEFRHPLARFSFKTVYADPTQRGKFTTKDLGMVYSRDILGEPGDLNGPARRLLEPENADEADEAAVRKDKSLEDLRFVPGDYLLVSVMLPKGVTMPTATTGPGTANWKGDGGWTAAPAPARGGAGGHWRGSSDAPPARGRGGRAATGRPVAGRVRGRRSRSFERGRSRSRTRSFSRSRTRSPPPRRRSPPRRSPPRRRGRYD